RGVMQPRRLRGELEGIGEAREGEHAEAIAHAAERVASCNRLPVAMSHMVARRPLPVTGYPLPVTRFPFPVSRFPFPVSRFPFPVSRLVDEEEFGRTQQHLQIPSQW